ncbi:IS66 family transposase [endosymbiont of Lamellibrachia barhami]|uniref:IS66 family transposase n=1 Tax=endosymbiont of Lamellibrachia barhami TaxID=205975 RepID=UPI0015AD2BB2
MQALYYIRQLYQVESAIRGKPPDERRRYRQYDAAPILQRFKDWLETNLMQILRNSEPSRVIRYTLAR